MVETRHRPCLEPREGWDLVRELFSFGVSNSAEWWSGGKQGAVGLWRLIVKGSLGGSGKRKGGKLKLFQMGLDGFNQPGWGLEGS